MFPVWLSQETMNCFILTTDVCGRETMFVLLSQSQKSSEEDLLSAQDWRQHTGTQLLRDTRTLDGVSSFWSRPQCGMTFIQYTMVRLETNGPFHRLTNWGRRRFTHWLQAFILSQLDFFSADRLITWNQKPDKYKYCKYDLQLNISTSQRCYCCCIIRGFILWTSTDPVSACMFLCTCTCFAVYVRI